jgi:hypothetical protein
VSRKQLHGVRIASESQLERLFCPAWKIKESQELVFAPGVQLPCHSMSVKRQLEMVVKRLSVNGIRCRADDGRHQSE